jgi:hypothetical protein
MRKPDPVKNISFRCGGKKIFPVNALSTSICNNRVNSRLCEAYARGVMLSPSKDKGVMEGVTVTVGEGADDGDDDGDGVTEGGGVREIASSSVDCV